MNNLIFSAIMLVLISLVPGLSPRQEESPILPGYIVRPTADGGFQVETSSVSGTRGAVRTLDTLPAMKQLLALSPDQRWLAITIISVDETFWLEVHDLQQRTVDRQSLPPTMYPDTGYDLDWSPDSAHLLVLPSSFSEVPILYNTQSQSLTLFEINPVRAIQWLDNGSGMLFHSSSVCGVTCAAFSDLYLAEYGDNQSITVRPITSLDVDQLNLRDRQTTKLIFVGTVGYHPIEDRLYLSLGEAETNPGGFELLYSTDFEGNLRFEADIAALDPDSLFPTRIQRIFYSPADQNIYVLTYTSGIGENDLRSRSAIFRLSAGQELTPIYAFDFNRIDFELRYTVTSVKLSPDGRYLALGLSGDVRARRGQLVVVDLLASGVVTQQETPQQVCEVFWSEDSTRVIYTQTDESPCTRLNQNLPVNRLIEYDIQANMTQTLTEDNTTPFYFFSSR